MIPLLKVIGNGPKSARDFTYEEAQQVIHHICEESYTPTQAGALLLAMRRKTSSQDEIRGFLHAWAEINPPIEKHDDGILIGNPFDGRKRSFPISPLSSLILSQSGTKVFIGGMKGLGPKCGTTNKDVVELLLSKPRYSSWLSPKLWDATELYPFYDKLTTSRNEISLRSFPHVIEKCFNPYGATSALVGVFHRPYAEKMRPALQENFKRSLLIFGEEGSVDMKRRGKSAYFRICGDEVQEGVIGLSDFGVSPLEGYDEASPETSLRFMNVALEQANSNESKALAAHLALMLFAKGENSLEDHLKEAELKIDQLRVLNSEL